MKRVLALVAAILLLAAPALAQSTEPELEIVDINGSRYPEQGQTQMVVEVRNVQGELDPAALTVTADGQEVTNLTVEPIGNSTVPVGVVLVIDASGSMAGEPIESAQAAAKSFIAQARPEDRVALVTFANNVQVLSGFTNNKDALNAAVDAIVADGETAFNDGVIQGVAMFDEPSSDNLLPNMIVLSDGADTASNASFDDALASVSNSDVRTFGVALEGSDFNPEPVAEIAAAGNGLFLSTPDPAQLSTLYTQIGQEISNTLVARFQSPVSTPGDVVFDVNYGELSASQTFAVSGFAPTTTLAPDESTTTTTLAPLTTIVVENNAPLDVGTLILIGAAGIGLTIFLFIIILFGREDEDDPGRFAKRLQAYGRRGGGQEEEKKGLVARLPFLSKFSEAAEEEVRKRGLLSGVNSTLEQANIPMSPGEAVLAMFGLALVGGIMAFIFNGLVWGLITFGVLLLLIVFFLRYAGNREKKRFEKQLPDTLTLMSTSLRAGYSLLQATEAVSSEAPDPTAREFGRAIAEARLGRTVSDALNGIVERTQSKDFEWAVMAIEIQREVGGNLAEVLTTVADTMRARNRLQGEIKALTAEGRISAIVLGALPFAMAAFLWFTNREYLQPLLDATFGRIAIGAGLLLMAGGIFWLKKIVDIEI
ncbi:MAG TPA: type II secretion system F family protein [Acidimicrobiia bacterium]|nr:type II secretion system F family protein [Acidimicrobiia bacterium]